MENTCDPPTCGNWVVSYSPVPNGRQREETDSPQTCPFTSPPSSNRPIPQLLYSTTGTTNIDLASVGIASVVTLAAASMDQSVEHPPHPQQGGRWITVQCLQDLPDTETQWAFWYVLGP